MPFDKLNEADREAFLTRLAARGRSPEMAQDVKDLVVDESSEIILSPETGGRHGVDIRRPADADELSKWIGVAPELRDNPVFRERNSQDNENLKTMLNRTKLLKRRIPKGETLRQVIADDPDAQDALRALVQFHVVGRLVPLKWPRYIEEEINSLTSAVDVCFLTWVNIVIKANGTLQFNPPGPYSVVAHSLTIEPGGRIVTNNVHVSYSVTNMTVL